MFLNSEPVSDRLPMQEADGLFLMPPAETYQRHLWVMKSPPSQHVPVIPFQHRGASSGHGVCRFISALMILCFNREYMLAFPPCLHLFFFLRLYTSMIFVLFSHSLHGQPFLLRSLTPIVSTL